MLIKTETGSGGHMTNEEIAIKVQDIDSRCKSNTHRLDEIAKNQEALRSLATSVAVMAAKQDTMNGTLETVAKKVDTLEKIPGKLWEFVVEKAIYVVVAAVVGFILARAGF
jgi:hypothetical protein